MIINLDQWDPGEVIKCDLCIAGSGAAGLSIALQFIDHPHYDVVVLEGGGRDFSAASQEIYQGRNLGIDYAGLDVTRLRYFGGTTNHWSGWCRPMDPMDFEVRSWVPHSGWPIGPKDIAPFRPAAHQILDLGGRDYAPETYVGEGAGLFQFDPKLLEHKLWWLNKPATRFKSKYQAAFEKAEAVTLYLNANLTNVQASPDGRRVVKFDVLTNRGKRLQVRSRHYVLALGGLENPRILLNSRSGHPNGLGNQHDIVGRYFMEHPHGPFGEILIEKDLDRGFGYPRRWGHDGLPGRVSICVTEAAQRDFKILNHSFTILSLSTQRNKSKGFRALLDLTGTMEDQHDDDFWKDVWELIKDIEGAAKGVYNMALGNEVPLQKTTIYTRCEQAPNPDSRVVLIDEVDRLGLRRIGLNWRLTELDKHTIRTATQILAREMGRQGLGRVKLPEWLLNEDPNDWPEELVGGPHHMGTTRMASDPRLGVVDKDCRVHGLENLYIAGSSVFPTGGFANPTLTIVELALRLAQHLKEGL
jgi:choline dehydrogenase-like flavoprotein